MAIAGKKGSIKLEANAIAETQSWSLDISNDMIEDTEHLVDWKTFISGLSEWSASAESSWAVSTDTDGQAAAQTAFLSGETVALKLYVDDTHYYSGTAYISSLSVEAPADGKVDASWELQGTGALTYN